MSSQVGCTLNCRFCHTGTMQLVRNLEPAEIVGQVMLARDALGEWPSQPEGRMLTNIVMMGMGEPLYNFDNVRDALKIVMDGDGLGLSQRRITLSTSGVVPMMARAGEEIGVNLAVSLHAVTKEVRDEIVPLNRKYGIEQLLEACAAYPGANNARRITFEYVMLKDKNDSDADARELVRLIRHYRLPAKVNLIPFNPWPGAPYECSSAERIRAFSNIVFEAGISAPVRTPRGRDIDAACGQLKTAAETEAQGSRRGVRSARMSLLGKLRRKAAETGSITLLIPGQPPRTFGPGGGRHLTVRLADRNAALAARPQSRGSASARPIWTGGSSSRTASILDLMRLIVGANRVGGRRQRPQGAAQGQAAGPARCGAATRHERARRNVAHHYDIGNDLYRLFLDDDLQYSCAYFTDPGNSLEQAQLDKKAHIAAKLYLKPGQHVLDIGCGWGGTALYLNRVAGVERHRSHAVRGAAQGRARAGRGGGRIRPGEVRADRLSRGRRAVRPDRVDRHVRACRRRALR